MAGRLRDHPCENKYITDLHQILHQMDLDSKYIMNPKIALKQSATHHYY